MNNHRMCDQREAPSEVEYDVFWVRFSIDFSIFYWFVIGLSLVCHWCSTKIHCTRNCRSKTAGRRFQLAGPRLRLAVRVYTVCFVYTCRRLIDLSLDAVCFVYTCRRLIDLSLDAVCFVYTCRRLIASTRELSSTGWLVVFIST